MDAGANTGTESCYFAQHAPHRVVHALDPVPANVKHMQRFYGGRFPNLRPFIGALGERPGTLRGVNVATRKDARKAEIVGGDQVTDLFARERRDNDNETSSAEADAGPRSVGALRVFTVDEIFANETLGFAHWDVEGSEYEVVSGARSTIARDAPIFTVETFMHTRPTHTERLLSLIASLGYESWLVDEVCGHPLDCRNVLNLPSGRMAALRASSPTLELAAASGRLLRLANGTISQMRGRIYPCCRPGGSCCPDPPPPIGRGIGCCSQAAVMAWLDGHESRPRREAAPPVDVPSKPRCFFC